MDNLLELLELCFNFGNVMKKRTTLQLYIPIQEQFNHFRMISERLWKALCNEAPFCFVLKQFCFGQNVPSSQLRTHKNCDQKSLGIFNLAPFSFLHFFHSKLSLLYVCILIFLCFSFDQAFILTALQFSMNNTMSLIGYKYLPLLPAEIQGKA